MNQETYSPALSCGYSLQEYTIKAVLGIGGFGITYLAQDNHLQHKVAIKEFFPANLAARNPATGTVGIKSPDCQAEFTWGKTRYTQEAQILARFNHPNIVRVYRYFETNHTSYLVMALEQGKSLAEALCDDSDWTQTEITNLLLPLLSGLAEIHKSGYLHRDIKPENILIRDKDNSPVLLDFGSARSLMSNHTMTAMVTPGYGPVEQYSTDQADQGPWTDIYAMAAVIYRIITGHPPIPAPNRVKKDTMLPAVFAGDNRYSQPFLKAIDKALSIDQANRPQTVTEWTTLLTTAHAAPKPEPTNTPEPTRSHRQNQAPLEHISTNTPTFKPIKPMPRVPRVNLAQNIKRGLIWLTLLIATTATVLLTTDKGYLNAAYYVYTTAIQAHNPDLTYALICPNYFKSGMTNNDLIDDIEMVTIAGQIKIDTPTRATLTTQTKQGHTKTQTWSKPENFWCRDVLTDYKTQQTKLKEERETTKRRTPLLSGKKR